MEEEKVTETRTRRKVAADEQSKKKEVAVKKAAALKGQYQGIMEHTAMVDLRKKIAGFSAYHSKIAQDGAGMDLEGKQFAISSEQRVSHMDKAAGIQEIADYLDRQLSS